MRAWQGAVVALGLLAPLGCSVNLETSASTGVAQNQCTDDSQCGSGACWTGGVCVAHEGAFSALLIEVAPPASAPGVGGVRFLQILTGLDRSNQDTEIALSPTTVVHGFVFAPDKQCGGQTVPVQVTLKPREESYGLQAVSYVAQTAPAVIGSGHPCVGLFGAGSTAREFVVAVPGGSDTFYDVYVEPLAAPALGDGGVPDACTIVPQLLRSQHLADSLSSTTCWQFKPKAPQTLDVVVPWPDAGPASASLDGWTLDVVHPITGEILSDRLTLRASDRGTTDYGFAYEKRELRFAPVDGDPPQKELVRLSPPSDAGGHPLGPTIQAERAGLQAALTKAVFPPMGPFPGLVALQSWVWKKGTEQGRQVPVPSDVTLTATKLEGIAPGIFASYTTTASVGDDGKLDVLVLPGTYRARITPRVGLGLGSAETTLDVQCAHDPQAPSTCLAQNPDNPPPPQAGKVLLVPLAAKITGDVTGPTDANALDRATVQAVPATIDALQCDPSADAAACQKQVLGVLDVSLGEDAFVPRPVSTIVDRGRFSLGEVDCGGCEPGSGAVFDLSVRPADGARFPWLVHPSVTVEADVALGHLRVPLPVVHRGLVDIPQSAAEPVPVPNALIKAYVLRNEQGEPIGSPSGLSSCKSMATNPTGSKPTQCIRSVLQVAETRASPEGKFELVVPASLE